MDSKVVIVADDDEFAQTTLSMMFTSLGVTIVQVKDGKEALDAYIAKNGAGIAYVLMDIHMPVMDGYESTRQIRVFEKSKGLAACKIFGLSGDNDAKTKSACTDSGMNDLLVKPVKKAQLQSLL